MVFVVLLACLAVVSSSSIVQEPVLHKAQPYKFGYSIKDKEGVQHRQEAGNGAGLVEGNYGFIDNKGLHRQVNYVADHAGFRAQVKTNEPGTAGQSPAAVLMLSNDPYAHGADRPYHSRVNDPVVPALYESDGFYGFPTIYGHRAYDKAPFTPVHGLMGHEHGIISPALDHDKIFPNVGHGMASPVLGHDKYAFGRGMVAPAHGHGLVSPFLGQGLLAPVLGGDIGRGYMQGPRYHGGLDMGYLGAGYKGDIDVVNYGANLVGGYRRGYDSRYVTL